MSHKQIEIYQGEIWTKSGCLDFENTFVRMVQQLLTVAGYTATNHGMVWQKHDRRVYLAVVDDVVRFDSASGQSALDCMTSRDLLITDGWISKPVLAEICQLPRSWYGIYSYQPAPVDHMPQRRYGLCVNRLDAERLAVFCELARVSDLAQDAYVNFNCQAHDRDLSDQEKQQRFCDVFYASSNIVQSELDPVFLSLQHQVPYCNHDLTVEQVHAASLVNLVMETYYQDSSIAFSEKIFRALVTARPWVVYAGKWAVARLRQLGFDVLDDLVNHHDYDEANSRELKYRVMVAAARQAADKVTQDPAVLARCQAAAEHNQQLLAQYRSQLAKDMGTWFQDFAQKL